MSYFGDIPLWNIWEVFVVIFSLLTNGISMLNTIQYV